MLINSLSVIDYRNIDFIKINPSENIYIIFGENAQGKTNLLESIWLFTGCKSFRTKKDSELTGFEKDFAKNEIEYFAFGREQTATLLIDKKRKAIKNGIELRSPAELIGQFYAVIFSPMHLSLIQDGPINRRAFLDTALCQLKPNYAKGLARYKHTLEQRNALLKDIQFHSELYDTLDVWDEKLSSYGAAVVFERIKYSKLLSKHADEIYYGISDGKEKLTVEYVNNTGMYIEDPYALPPYAMRTS